MTFPPKADPVPIHQYLWPTRRMYSKQREMLRSVWANVWTLVPAGNMMGKDWQAGTIVPMAFLTRSPCRIVNSSATDKHLKVLWGEIGQALDDCRVPLTTDKGGPIVVNDQFLRKLKPEYVGKGGQRQPWMFERKSYVISIVAGPETTAAMQGHHVANVGDGVWRTLFVGDEASAIPEEHLKMVDSWANRGLLIGNTWPCENRFRWGCPESIGGGRPGSEDRGGDRYSPDGTRCYRKVIHIPATESPNVQLALRQIAEGIEPTREMVVDGVKSWDEYEMNRSEWPVEEQAVKLRAVFYRGSENMIFPPEWLDRADRIAAELDLRYTSGFGGSRLGRQARGIGIDPAEGRDKTAMCAVDDLGVIELVAAKTPDTDRAYQQMVEFCLKHGAGSSSSASLPWSRVCIDRGGGQQHADRMRASGMPIRTVAFGEAVQPELKLKKGKTLYGEQVEAKEQGYEYANRRAQMYYELSELMDPAWNPAGFGLPRRYYELKRQLGAMPKKRGKEGQLMMLPKNRVSKTSKEPTLVEILGCSPDEADATVLAVHGMLHRATRQTAGALV